MGKAIAIVVVLVLAGLALLVFQGAKKLAPAETEAATSSLNVNVPNLGLQQKADAIANKVTEGAKEAAKELSGNVRSLKADKSGVELGAGEKTDVKVTRIGGDMKAQKLELIPASGAKLTASGGAFAQGQAVTTVTVEAGADFKSDASLTIKANDDAKVLIAVKAK